MLQFFIWLKESNAKAGDFGPEHITKGDVIEFLTACAHRGLTGVSRARKLAAIREYYRYLVDHEIIAKSPTTGVETPKKEQNIRKHLAPHEYNTVLSVAGGNRRDYAIFQVVHNEQMRFLDTPPIA